jgi:DNA-binding XRE family transcriptional regulator
MMTDEQTALMIDLLADGMRQKDVAAIVGVSPVTINKRVEELKKEENTLLAYDKNRYLDLISVQQRIIANVTDDKLAAAPLQHLASAYAQFGKMEQLIQGKPTEIHGLMGYLLHLEKEEIEKVKDNSDAVDASFVSPSAPEQLELDL